MAYPAVGETVYRKRYQRDPQVTVQAPGWVEILGNHTDCNGGFVLSVTLDRRITLQGESVDEPSISIYSQSQDEEIHFSLESLKKDPAYPWAYPIQDVLCQIKNRGIPIGGFQAVAEGNLPPGGDIGSSAALKVATLLLMKELYPFEKDTLSLAMMCGGPEIELSGNLSGCWDSFPSLFGGKDRFLLLDCQSFHHKTYSLSMESPRLVLCNSGVRYEKADDEWRIRRSQCESAARTLGEHIGRQVNQLRDITILEFMDLEDILDDMQRMRARHVLYENQRVLRGVAALQLNDLNHLGELMYQSHQSSRDLLETSCPELDWLVDEAVRIPGCYGAKLSGRGFGGWTVNLVKAGRVDFFIETISERFLQHYGRSCEMIDCGIGEGARIL